MTKFTKFVIAYLAVCAVVSLVAACGIIAMLSGVDLTEMFEKPHTYTSYVAKCSHVPTHCILVKVPYGTLNSFEIRNPDETGSAHSKPGPPLLHAAR